MNYQALFEKIIGQTAGIGVIGSGHYATAIITQSVTIPFIEVSVIADIQTLRMLSEPWAMPALDREITRYAHRVLLHNRHLKEINWWFWRTRY